MKAANGSGENLRQRASIHGQKQQTRSIIPVCCICQRIRTIDDAWEKSDIIKENEGNQNLTHAFCPECLKLHYPLIYEDKKNQNPVL